VIARAGRHDASAQFGTPAALHRNAQSKFFKTLLDFFGPHYSHYNGLISAPSTKAVFFAGIGFPTLTIGLDGGRDDPRAAAFVDKLEADGGQVGRGA
jgi:hypothetical protein